MQNKAQLKLKITIARSTVMMFAFLTAFNVWLTLRASEWTLPFSSVISSYSVALTKVMADLEGASTSFIYAAVAVSAVIVALLVYVYFSSKNRPLRLRCVLYFVIIDTISIIFILLNSGTSVSYLIELPMHALMIFYLYRGITSAEKLDLQERGEEGGGSGDSYDEECDKVFEISAEHEGHCVESALYGGELVLAIDGTVYDRAGFEAKYDYELTAECDGHSYSVYYDDTEQIISLFADGEQICSKSV
ncbi:MAG: hypothetical protein IKX92_01650 [Clostridia bacterium]|nr:hypothetical protein [Clostridia bacterium]